MEAARAERAGLREGLDAAQAEIEVKSSLIAELENAIVDMRVTVDEERRKRQDMQGLVARLLRQCRWQIVERVLSGAVAVWWEAAFLATQTEARERLEKLQGNLKLHQDEKQQLEADLAMLMNGTYVLEPEEGTGGNLPGSGLLTGISVLEMGLLFQIGSSNNSKASAVCTNLKAQGYTDEECNTVCRAVFLEHTDEQLRPCWELFAKGKKTLDTDDFKRILPLMGERVPEARNPVSTQPALC